MRMLYYAPKVNKLGGPDVLVDRLTDKFGKKPTYKKIGDEDWLIWNMPDAQKTAGLKLTTKLILIQVTDTAVDAKLDAAKKSVANTGF